MLVLRTRRARAAAPTTDATAATASAGQQIPEELPEEPPEAGLAICGHSPESHIPAAPSCG